MTSKFTYNVYGNIKTHGFHQSRRDIRQAVSSLAEFWRMTSKCAVALEHRRGHWYTPEQREKRPPEILDIVNTSWYIQGSATNDTHNIIVTVKLTGSQKAPIIWDTWQSNLANATLRPGRLPSNTMFLASPESLHRKQDLNTFSSICTVRPHKDVPDRVSKWAEV